MNRRLLERLLCKKLSSSAPSTKICGRHSQTWYADVRQVRLDLDLNLSHQVERISSTETSVETVNDGDGSGPQNTAPVDDEEQEREQVWAEASIRPSLLIDAPPLILGGSDGEAMRVSLNFAALLNFHR